MAKYNYFDASGRDHIGSGGIVTYTIDLRNKELIDRLNRIEAGKAERGRPWENESKLRWEESNREPYWWKFAIQGPYIFPCPKCGKMVELIQTRDGTRLHHG